MDSHIMPHRAAGIVRSAPMEPVIRPDSDLGAAAGTPSRHAIVARRKRQPRPFPPLRGWELLVRVTRDPDGWPSVTIGELVPADNTEPRSAERNSKSLHTGKFSAQLGRRLDRRSDFGPRACGGLRIAEASNGAVGGPGPALAI